MKAEPSRTLYDPKPEVKEMKRERGVSSPDPEHVDQFYPPLEVVWGMRGWGKGLGETGLG